MSLKFEDLVVGKRYTVRLVDNDPYNSVVLENYTLIDKCHDVIGLKPQQLTFYTVRLRNNDGNEHTMTLSKFKWDNNVLVELSETSSPAEESCDSENDTVITLAGSHRFKELFTKYMKDLTRTGHAVLLPPCYYITDDELDEEQHKKAIDIHKKMIERSDAILVVNPGGYIGGDTQDIIDYAKTLGVCVKYTHQRCRGIDDMQIGKLYRFRFAFAGLGNIAVPSWRTERLISIDAKDHIVALHFERITIVIKPNCDWSEPGSDSEYFECYLDDSADTNHTPLPTETTQPETTDDSNQQNASTEDPWASLSIGKWYSYRIKSEGHRTLWQAGRLKEIYPLNENGVIKLVFDVYKTIPDEPYQKSYCFHKNAWGKTFVITSLDRRLTWAQDMKLSQAEFKRHFLKAFKGFLNWTSVPGVCYCKTCPFCKDQNNQMYLYIDPLGRNHPIRYHCKKCGAHGVMNESFLSYFGLDYLQIPESNSDGNINQNGETTPPVVN